MSSQAPLSLETNAHDYEQYRALSMSAVASLVLGLISIVGLAFPALLVIPLGGTLFGFYALHSVRKKSAELTGSGLALTGTILCGVFFMSGLTLATVIYLTEVPEGYQRISFLELQPDAERPHVPVSSRALELDGQKVFVKGYIYPGDRRENLKQFVLVPDMKTCCFGGQPKLTDMIEVSLRDPLTTDWAPTRRKLSGVLKVDTRKKPVSGLDGVYYQLEADRIQ